MLLVLPFPGNYFYNIWEKELLSADFISVQEGLTKNIRFRPPTKSWQIIVTEQRDRYATICMSEFSAKPSYWCWRNCFAFRYGVTEPPKKLVPQAASVIELIVDSLYMPIY